MNATTPPNTGEITQLATICPIFPQCTASNPIPATANPTSAPTIECVVETGHPLAEATASQIGDAQMRFSLWLPGDEEPLEYRTRALAQWCSGFLAGLGFGHNADLDNLSEDIEGVLADLQQIARAETDPETDPETEETALVEIIEYIRVVALMLREELRPAAPRDSVH